MLKHSNFTKIMLLATAIVLFTACSEKGKAETNATTDSNVTVEQNTTTVSGDDNASTGGSGEDNHTTDDNTTTDGGDDNATTTPTTTPISLKLTINKTTLNKEENTTVKVEATYADNSTKEVTDKVEWVVTPSDAVKVTKTTLTALKDKATTVKAKLANQTSEAVSLNITWTVNGHVLPPEPDKTLNDSTLLGIDSNNDGVRDDVERYIYERFEKDLEYPKTKIALAMQHAWATQKVLENPVIESEKYYADALACQEFWINTKTSQMSAYDYMQYSKKHKVFNDERLRDMMFNTKERVLRDFEFNKACSGNIFEGSPDTIESCQKDITTFGE